MLHINVNEHTEKKNGLTYLSWAWAWAEVLKHDPEATWEAVEFPSADGTLSPCMYVGNQTAMVKTSVTIKGKTRTCLLPVMDHRNKAIPQPDAFAINTAIMRCMTKAISMHGLGLYIYAGEDLPESDKIARPAKDVAHSGPAIAFADLSPDWQAWVTEWARDVANTFEQQGPVAANALIKETIEREQLEDGHQVAMWSKLDSKTRSALKAVTA